MVLGGKERTLPLGCMLVLRTPLDRLDMDRAWGGRRAVQASGPRWHVPSRSPRILPTPGSAGAASASFLRAGKRELTCPSQTTSNW